jgi:hypothetical protein
MKRGFRVLRANQAAVVVTSTLRVTPKLKSKMLSCNEQVALRDPKCGSWISGQHRRA